MQQTDGSPTDSQDVVNLQDGVEQQIADYREQALEQFALRRYGAAVEIWDQLLALDLIPVQVQAQAQAWYHRGMALDCLGSHELALHSYDRLIELQPENHLAWGNRAIALRKLGRDGEAAEAARRAFELNPDGMVNSFFEQLRSKQPRLAFLWEPLQRFVLWARRA